MIKDAGLPTSGVLVASANLSFPVAPAPTGPTSILLRFDGQDKHIGPGADDWSGYEVAIQPGRVSLVPRVHYHFVCTS